MILNVPTAEDFKEHGIMFLNFAWDTVFNLLLHISDSQEWAEEQKPKHTAKDWATAKKPVSIAHALAQQGSELIVKSIIAKESPYLLIKDSHKNWPKYKGRKGIDFADFRTIDAQDLIQVCNKVRQEPLPNNFTEAFNRLRKRRNALFHTVDKKNKFSDKEMIEYILDSVDLVAPKEWPQLRRKYLSEDFELEACEEDGSMGRLSREMVQMIELLHPGKLKSLFGFNKKQRKYVCPHCSWEFGRHDYTEYPRTAQLKPNSPDSTNVYCFVCDKNTPVTREKCTSENCKGNVINTVDDIMCLTCFEY